MLKLYHSPSSVCSIKVRLGLAEIGLDYDSEILDFSKGEQHQKTYLTLNPDGVVPTLMDGDLVVVESSLILEYLDRYYNQGRLTPTDRAAATMARHWLVRTLTIHAAINTLTFTTAGRDRILASQTPDEISAAIAKMPDPGARLKRVNLVENGLSSPYVEQAMVQLRRTFCDMATCLAENPWVTGAAFGIADIALVSYIDRLQRLGFAGLWDADTPRVGRWLDHMQARPSYDIAVTALIDPKVVRKTRQSGEKYWPKLKQLWIANHSAKS